MDTERFDTLTRVLASRRSLTGGLAAGMLTAIFGRDAEAHNALPACQRIKNKRRRNACRNKARRHNAQHKAAAANQCQGHNVCFEGDAAACGAAGNNCVCWVTPAGASVCGSLDGSYVAATCGDCEQEGRTCVQGGGTFCEGPVVCVLPCCPPGFRECGGRCVDVLRDSNNCGACGRSCGIDRPNICAGGSCCIDAGGTSPCSYAPSGGACAPVGGACCAGGGACTNGVCP